MNDTIYRQQAIDALRRMQTYKLFAGDDMLLIDQAGAQTELMLLPSAQLKHGRWILNRSGAYCCSECMEPCAGYVMMRPRDKFCKMCGARIANTIRTKSITAITSSGTLMVMTFVQRQKGENNMELKFDWRWKDYGLRATPKRLVRFDKDESNETIDFIKYFKCDDKEMCYSIGYFYYNEHEPCWELKFVGNRFKDIAPEDLLVVWKYLLAAYDVLTEWKNIEQDI